MGLPRTATGVSILLQIPFDDPDLVEALAEVDLTVEYLAEYVRQNPGGPWESIAKEAAITAIVETVAPEPE